MNTKRVAVYSPMVFLLLVSLSSFGLGQVITTYQDFASQVDFLNGRDPVFPEPVPPIFGSQSSDRFSFSTALRSTLTPALVNEARFGLTGGTVVFFPETSAGSFQPFGGVATQFPLTLTNPYSGVTNSRRNAPVWQFTDNLSWSKGRHNLNFGGSYNKTTFFQEQSSNLVPTATFGILTAIRHDRESGLQFPQHWAGGSSRSADLRAVFRDSHRQLHQHRFHTAVAAGAGGGDRQHFVQCHAFDVRGAGA